MFRAIMIVGIALFLPTAIAHAETGPSALGIIMGEPTGISLKTWLGEDTAVGAAAAWSFVRGEEAFHLHVDYLHHRFDLFEVERGRLALFYGIGTAMKTEQKTRLSARIPLGLTYLFESAPMDVFLEMVPLLDLAPSTEGGFNAGAGVHYYF